MNPAQHDPQHQTRLAEAKRTLNELDAQIQQLQAKSEKQAADARIEYGNELDLDELRRRRDALGERLKELQQSGGDALNGLQSGLESTATSVREKVRSALDRFR